MKGRLFLLILIGVIIIMLSAYQLFFADKTIRFNVMLIYQPTLSRQGQGIKAAYSRVLEEEGVPYLWQTRSEILKFSPAVILKNSPVIIFPDEIARNIPLELEMWIEKYVSLGGSAMMVYDAGVSTINGFERKKYVFSKILGLNFEQSGRKVEDRFQSSKVQFMSKEFADFFRIPPGKLNDDLVISDREGNFVELPTLKIRIEDFNDDLIVYAKTCYADDSVSPNIFQRNLGRGKVFFVNLPLGRLKAFNSSDLLLRSTLTSFLFRIVKIPHISGKQFNKGSLVINWHLGHKDDRANSEIMIRRKLVRKEIRQSFHIAAGDFLREPGDEQGFDAADKGRSTVKRLAEFGRIGSLGGCTVELFKDTAGKEKLTRLDLDWNIKKNSQILSDIAGYKIKEFSSPDGLHPQPVLTEILEKNGYNSYYYSGDAGSQPNRIFFDGNLISDQVIAFPQIPFFHRFSVAELGYHKTEAKLYLDWLLKNLNFISQNKTTFVIQSSFQDFVEYPSYIPVFNQFLDEAIEHEKLGKIQIRSMSYFAETMLRFLSTQYSFEIRDDRFRIELSNPEGLIDFCIALPRNLIRRPAGHGFRVESDENYYYIILRENINTKILTFPLR